MSKTENSEVLLSVDAPSITIEFGENIQFRDGEVFIEESKLAELKDYNSWIQVLDENGNAIYGRYQPEEAPAHYTPGKLIFYHKYTGAIDGYTIFVGIADRGEREFSYVMGFPEQNVAKASYLFSPDTFLSDLNKLFFGMLLVILVFALLIGYFSSSKLVSPILKVINAIQNLAKGYYLNRYADKGIFRDVHMSLNELGETLQSNELERKKIDRMREEWIANITHDLRTPLSSIKGYSEIILDPDYELSTEEREKYVKIILKKSNYMENLTEDLKLTYQLKNELVTLEVQPVNVVEVVRETVIDILNHPEHELSQIDFQPTEKSIVLNIDRKLLQRAISNLIYNAIVHNPKGTEVHVYMKDGPVIEIEDHGRGIPKPEVDRLFDRYYRGTNTGEAHKGTGLGMAIAKQIIEAHGGTIEVESTLYKGTLIRIDLTEMKKVHCGKMV